MTLNPNEPNQLPVRITYLAEQPEVIQLLVGWFFQEWPDYFEGQTIFEMAIAFSEACKTSELDMALIAVTPDNRLAGVVTLSATGPMDYQGDNWPWIKGLFVNPMFRGQGIGKALLQAAIEQARRLKFPSVFAGSLAMADILENAGFAHIETIDMIYQELPIFQKNL